MLTALLNKWVWVGLLGLTLSGLTWAYLDTRDKLAVERERVEYERSVTFALQENLDRLQARSEALERARIELAKEVQRLRVQEVETVTQIRTIYRDREVYVESPQSVECAAVPLPRGVIGLLCDASDGLRGACVSQDPAGHADGMPHARSDG